jgi:hypothetical protein
LVFAEFASFLQKRQRLVFWDDKTCGTEGEMTATTAFKNTRAISQLMSVTLILINIPLVILLIVFQHLVVTERDLAKLGMRCISFLIKVTSMVNITLGLLASCGINSRTKFYMRFFLLAAFISVSSLFAIFVYVRELYLKQLLLKLGQQSVSNLAIKSSLEGNYDCNFSTRSCEAKIRADVENITMLYSIVAIASLVLNVINFILIKFAVEINIEAPLPKPPTLVEKTRVGMNTESLRNKRIITVEAPRPAVAAAA